MKNKVESFSKYLLPLIVVVSLMFFWNFCRNINDILIPHLKRACQLNDFQSSLIQSAFFGAYFLVAVPAGYFIERYGYKAGMILGLLLAATGAFLFYPAALTRLYPFFLFALFVMAAGFTFLEVTVTPYVSKLGPGDQASSRLSFAAAMGSVGAALGPYAGSLFLLSQHDVQDSAIAQLNDLELELFLMKEAELVIAPYLALAGLFLLLTLVIYKLKLPEIKEAVREKRQGLAEVMKYRHTLLGVLAVFCYLGAEIGVVSFFIRFAKSLEITSLTERQSALFITFYMLFVLGGRLLGSYLLNHFASNKVLAFCTMGAVGLLFITMNATGYAALYALSLVGLFTSIMYPVIFTLSIKGIGELTKIASSLLIMGCVGGALIPPVMGLVSDNMGIKEAFIVPVICFLFVLYFAFKGHKVVLKTE